MDKNPQSSQLGMDGQDQRGEEARVSEASVVTQEETPENAGQGHQLVEHLTAEWTDEKHSLYLNSVEESFVRQLHNRDHHFSDVNRWLLRRQKVLDRKSSQSNANCNLSSGQFKVLRGGCWENHNFERVGMKSEIGNESSIHCANPLTQHVQLVSVAKEPDAAPVNVKGDRKLVSEATHLPGKKYRTPACGLATSLKQFHRSYSAIYGQKSIGGNTEVSDQNFVEEECEGEPLSRSSKKRRLRTAVADASSKDQVVPLGNSPAIVSANLNYSLRKEDEHCSSLQLEKTTSSASPPEYGPPSFQDQ